MITEIVTFKIAKDLDRDAVVALYEKSAPGWKSNPHLIHKSFLYDAATGTGGGVYLWDSVEAAKESHGEVFRSRISEVFGSTPEFAYFETPVVITNHSVERPVAQASGF